MAKEKDDKKFDFPGFNFIKAAGALLSTSFVIQVISENSLTFWFHLAAGISAIIAIIGIIIAIVGVSAKTKKAYTKVKNSKNSEVSTYPSES